MAGKTPYRDPGPHQAGDGGVPHDMNYGPEGRTPAHAAGPGSHHPDAPVAKDPPIKQTDGVFERRTIRDYNRRQWDKAGGAGLFVSGRQNPYGGPPKGKNK